MAFLEKHRREQKEILKFLVLMILLSSPMYVIAFSGISLMPLQSAVAAHTVMLLGLLGTDASLDGVIISAGSGQPFVFSIGPDCTAWKSMLLFFALVFATPGRAIKSKAISFSLGLITVYTANLIRIVFVASCGISSGYGAAMTVHDILWQAGLPAVVLAMWIFWLKYADLRKILESRINI